jgi:type II secretory pathway pseudopilin PulG
VIFRRINDRGAAFTLVEVLLATGIFGAFAAALLAVWSTLGYSALNTTTFAHRQNDQMRVLDYLKRDIHRSTKVELYNGATLVTGTTTFASELRLTIPDFYADSRAEDDVYGATATNGPVLNGTEVAYGTALTVRYFTSGGAGIRREADVSRTVADAAGVFAFSFKRETNGAIRCRIVFEQPLRGQAGRKLQRTVDTLCVPRSELRL